MKIFILILLISTIGFVSCKQKSGSSSTGTGSGIDANLADQIRKERIDHNKRIYDMAVKVHDNYTQLNALYNIMADDSVTDNLKHMDSVAEIYLRISSGYAALKMAEKILVKDPENEKMMELKSEGLVGQGKDEEALNINRKLYEKTKKIKYLFNIANVQLEANNMKDLGQTIDHIKTSPTFQKDSIDVADNQTGRLQKVPAPAVMAYLEAMIGYQKKDIKEMVAKLKQAVAIFPNYINANRTIQAFMQQQQQAAQQQQQQQPQQVPPPGQR